MKNKILSLFLLFNIFFTSLPIYATELEEVNSNKVFSSTVNAEAESSFNVQIPKIIELTDSDSNGSYDANYTITAIGDIAGDEVLSVVPDSSITFTTDGKDSIIGTVTQNKTTWYYDEFDTVANGSITTSDFSAGSWIGELNFDISLDIITLQAGLYDANGVMLCSWEDSGIDVEKNYDLFADCINPPEEMACSVLTNKYPATTTMILPNNVNEIGNLSLAGTNLENIIISDSITSIGDFSFMGSQISNIIIPDNVTSVGVYSFYNCSNLEEVILSENLEKINTGLFINCSSLNNVEIKSNINSIESQAFYGCNSLKDLELPGSITSIGDFSFYNCTNLTSLSFINTELTIGQVVFDGCDNLTNIEISDNTNISNISKYTFEGTPWLTTQQEDATDGLVIINDILVDGSQATGDVIIPDNVTSISDYAFYNNDNIISVVIPESVLKIKGDAFSGCSNLSNINISNTVDIIEDKAFEGTPWLTTQQEDAADGLVIINDILIDGSQATGDVIIPDNVDYISDYAFNNNDNITSIVIPEKFTYIPNHLFSNCTNLTNVEMSNNITKIESYAFSGCSNLSDINISNSVDIIDYKAFEGTPWLTTQQENATDGLVIVNDILIDGSQATGDVIIPENVTYISRYAFDKNNNITSVVIPEGVTKLNERLFGYCENLKVVTIPNTVKYMGYDIFGEEIYVDSSIIINYKGNREQWNNIKKEMNGALLYTFLNLNYETE